MTFFIRTVVLPALTVLASLTVQAAAPRLNGMAVHTQLGKEQFIAAIYTETPTAVARELLTAEEDKIMELHVLTENLYARRFQRMWIEGIAINAGPLEMEKHAQHLADFSNLLRIKMTTGDVLRIERLTQQQTTRIAINGNTLGAINDARFFDLLLRVWVGPVPLSSDFKDGLLANGKVAPELLSRFNSITPDAARVAEVAAALQNTTSQIRPDKGKDKTPSSAADPNAVVTPSDANINATTTGVTTVIPDENPAPTDGDGDSTAGTAVTAAEPPTPPPPEELLTADALFGDDTIFDDEDKEAYSFTAENLLSEQIYIAKLTKWTSNFVKYPRAALRSQQEGTVRITVTLGRDGRIKDVQVLEKSEHDTLNKAATRAVKSASPYPAVPEEIPGEQFLFTVPVVFKLD